MTVPTARDDPCPFRSQHPLTQRARGVPAPYERQHAACYLCELVPRGWRKETLYHFAVEDREGGALATSVTVHHHAGTWGIGYWTLAEHRGRGYATEAVLALVNWSFKERGVQHLEWRAEAGNMDSWAVAQKAGFVREGTLRAAQTNSNSLRDTWIGALLPSDLGLAFALPYQPVDSDLPG
ncbi:GNAT family N-acetyltransferase [Streptomyces tanashiensis]|uniref:GNAT family N-acetyltransferase n=1 Tax=Streptomyces tanashiensis TaxID=67367 RepID=UPI0033CE3AD0